jgi:peptidoglycan hydrolase CwlO-like protein
MDHGRGHESDSVKDELLASLRDQVKYLRQESERKDAIIMQLAQTNATLAARVPELEAPQEQPAESPETDSKEADDKGAAPPAEEERRSWWRRLFGP